MLLSTFGSAWRTLLPRFALMSMVVVLATGGCTCPGDVCEPCIDLYRDAGMDTGSDGGRDSGQRHDVGHDSGHDGGPRGSARWTRFGDLPDECPVEVALDPDNVPLEVGWEECGAGCRRWSGTPGLRWLAGRPGHVWVSAIDYREPRLEATIAMLDLATSGVVAAFRETNDTSRGPACYIDAATSADDVAISVSFSEFDASGEMLLRDWTRFYRGRVDELPSMQLLAHREEYVGSVQTLLVSPTRVAAEANGTSAYAIDDGLVTIANRALYPNYVQELHLVGDDLFWTDWGDRISIARATREAGGDGSVFYAVDGGDVRSFSTDGETFAWLQAFDQDPETLLYARVELWTATYDGAQFVDPHRVRDLPWFNNGVVGAGLFVIQEQSSVGALPEIAIYRLADGARAASTPGNPHLGRILYVSESDVLIDAPAGPIRIDPSALTFE